MTRPFNTKHPFRGKSHYKSRLENRGYTRTPIMVSLEDLRKQQGSMGDEQRELWLERQHNGI